MRYQEFIAEVVNKAELEEREAGMAVAAFLMTLGELIPRAGRDDLAAQLPKEFAAAFAKERIYSFFDLEEFYHRVSARSQVGYIEAGRRSRAVADVLRAAVSHGEIRKVMTVIPDGYNELFPSNGGEAAPRN